MSKAKHHHNPEAAEFTDYTVASSKHGLVKAAVCKAFYAAERLEIQHRRMNRLDNRFWDTRQKPHPIKVRGGYPKKRVVDDDIPSHRGVPHSGFLKQFKLVDRLVFSEALKEFVYSTKVYVLHATRGWKLYA